MSDLFDRILLLKKSHIFSEVTTEDLRVVAQTLEKEVYVSGDRVFDINHQGDRMYMIESGKIGISTHPDPTIKDFVAVMGPGDCFGEMNLLDELPRSATAHVIENSSILSLHKNRLRGLVLNYPELSLGIMKSLSLRLRNTTLLLQKTQNT
jgi:CRP/FNR family cyclic AMP-dependent transcriptional regulator